MGRIGLAIYLSASDLCFPKGDGDEIAYSPVGHAESKRTLYTAHFVFLFRDSVPNELIQVNPLGLAITYFREDEAFQ